MRLVVERGEWSDDVVGDVAGDDTTLGDLVAAVVMEAGHGGGEPCAAIDVDGRVLPLDTFVDEAGLYDGAVVRLLPPASDDTPPSPTPLDGPAPRIAGLALASVGGVDAGRWWPLPDRPLGIGRGATCDVVLDDPAASTSHAELAPGPVVRDLGSRNGTWVDGARISDPAGLAADRLLEVGTTQLRVVRTDPADRPVTLDPVLHSEAGTVAFNRPPRARTDDAARELIPPAAPEDGAAGRRIPFSVATIVGPLLMGGVMCVIYGNPRFALFALLSPLSAAIAAVSARRRRGGRRRVSRRYTAALRAFADDLAAEARAEAARRERCLPDAAEIVRRATLPSVRLWERRTDHADAFQLRAGLGRVRWTAPVAAGRGEPLAADVQAVVDHHATLWQAPVDVDLAAGQAVGIVGARAAALALARSLVCQAVVLHGPADLRLGVFAGNAHADAWDWAKWLPHLRDPDSGVPRSGTTTSASEAMFTALLDGADTGDRPLGVSLLSRREADAGPLTLYVLDDVGLVSGRRAAARRLLRGAAGPAAAIVVAETADQLPALCTTVVTVQSDLGAAELRRPADGNGPVELVIAGLSDTTARTCARHLARYADPEVETAGAGLPTTVRLLDLLGLREPDAAAIRAAWTASARDPRPRAPIGVGPDGPALVDLIDDGPHGLVGGTTGAGKSELCRTLVVGLAARLSPDHLTFVLVDYKGGSAFDVCTRLPHVVGLVTDLDEHLGERALVSLEAELAHRERLLRDAGVSDLPSYLDAGAPAGPLPRLVVVVDEFATLAAELPDFLGALVGVAQRGRSLGVHLLLATQRPQGAVNANIKANTNLRIALRVQDPADSQDIIDRRDAAAIPRSCPGRAFVRRGHGDVSPVQTALATAACADGTALSVRPFRLDAPAGAATSPDRPTGATDLDRLVAAICEAAREPSITSPRRPWLDPLPDHVPFPLMPSAAGDDDRFEAPADPSPRPAPGSSGRPDQPATMPLAAGDDGAVAFALADDPAQQARRAVGWEPADGHLLILGMVGSGATTALVAVARALAEARPVDACHLYALDFGAGGLAGLAALPHTGAVLAAGDREAQLRLIRLLRAELERRRELRPDELADEPLVVTCIDGIGTFLAEFEGLEGAEVADSFRRVWAEGPAVRLVCVVTGDRTGALPMRLNATVSQRLLLRLADPNEFASVGLRPRQLPQFVPGRGIHGASRLVVQVADPGGPETLRDVGAVLAREQQVRRPPPGVRTLPADVPAAQLPPATIDDGLRIPVGLGEADLEPVALELFDGTHAVVAGPPRSGRSTLLRLVAHAVRAADPHAVLVGVCDQRSPLYDMACLDAAGTAAELASVLRGAVQDSRRWCVLVDGVGAVDDTSAAVLTRLATCERPGLHVVGAGRSDDFRTLTSWARHLRKSRTGVLLQPDLALDGDILTVRLPRRIPVALQPGRGFLVTAGAAQLSQFATP